MCRIVDTSLKTTRKNYHAPIIFDGEPITEKRERVQVINAVSPGMGVWGKSFTKSTENIIDQKITGG